MIKRHKQKLSFLVERSNSLYLNYKNEPIYARALHLKSTNSEIIKFLLKDGYLFNDNTTVNIIINHFESWIFQFLEFEIVGVENKNTFVFERSNWAIPYPYKEIEILLNK